MTKGYQCPNCEKYSGEYKNGSYQCTNEECLAIWWGPFDKPSAGERRKGYKCFHCGRQTVHPVGQIGSVKIWRCSTCAATQLERID